MIKIILPPGMTDLASAVRKKALKRIMDHVEREMLGLNKRYERHLHRWHGEVEVKPDVVIENPAEQ